MVMVVGVIVIVAVVGAAAYLIWGGGSDNNDNPTINDVAVGNFLKYDVLDTLGVTSMESVYYLNVTAINTTGYTVLVTEYLNGGLYQQSTQHLNKARILTYFGTWPNKVDKGPMTINTHFGSRDVEHYQYEISGTTWDIYLGVNNGVLYRYTTSTGTQTGETNLVDSNLSWV